MKIKPYAVIVDMDCSHRRHLVEAAHRGVVLQP